MFETSKAIGILKEVMKIQKLVMANAEGLDIGFGEGKSVYMGFMVHKPHTMPNAEELCRRESGDTTTRRSWQ